MSQDTNVSNLIINKLTKQQYEGITTPDPTQLYFITDEGEALSGLSDVSLSSLSNGQILKYNSSTSKWENTAAPSSAVWGNITGTLSNQTDLSTALNGKQDTLVSGTSIKTINSTSLLGSGNINVLQNTATSTSALTILGNPTQYVAAINIGNSSYANDKYALAIGENAIAGSEGSIMLGYGSNTNKSLVIGFPVKNGNIYTSQTYELLDGTTGLIPDARISSNIARTSALPSLATTSTAGIVQPDGSTITVSNGVISAVSDNSKADTDLSNLSSTGKEKVTEFSFPNGTIEELTLGASGTGYTATYDCWFYYNLCFYNIQGVGIISAGTASGAISTQSQAYNGAWGADMIPVSKGETVIFNYYNTQFSGGAIGWIKCKGAV